jgi:GAF domain-containing protein
MPTVPDPPTPDPVPQLVSAQLATIVLGAQPLTPTLQRIAGIALQVIPELVDVSITLIEDERPRTVVFTGPLAMELDERQYTDGYGPCTDAAITGGTIIVDTIIVDTTSSHSGYPGFARAAARRGITSTLSVGLPIPQPAAGALNMYSGANQPISENSIAAAAEFARYAAVAVANAALYHAAADTALQLSTALQSRAVIEQAKGIIMGREHCTPDEAFRVLARTSQHHNQKLRDIAAAIAARTIAAPTIIARTASRPSGPGAPSSDTKTGSAPARSGPGPGPKDANAGPDPAPKPVRGQTAVHSSTTHQRSGPRLPPPATSPTRPTTFEADAGRRADSQAR